MSNWNASNYRQRVAERLTLVKPQWVEMPSGEKFYLRKVAPMISSALAGSMPSALTKHAVEAWKEDGVEGLEGANVAEMASKMSNEELAAGAREMKRLSGIVQQACVIPFLSNDDPEEIEFTDEWKAAVIEGLGEDYDAETFDPKALVVDPRDLDEADAEFLLYRWATGIAGSLSLKGGGAVNSNDLLQFRKRLNRGSRTGNARQKHRKSA
jgi:hypothetical protein